MQQVQDETTYFFVDESGDSAFYDKKGRYIVGQPGCSKLLLVGFVRTKRPEPLRQALLDLKTEVCSDPLLQNIPSVKRKTAIAFHAKDDCPQVRERVYKLLGNLDFDAQIVVGRKIERIFRGNRIKGQANRFYDHLVTQLFKNVLHLSQRNFIYFAVRGSRRRQKPLEQAIEAAVRQFEQRWNTRVGTERYIQPQTPSGEPCLQIIDYVNWAVHRAYTTGDMQFFELIRDRVSLVVDLYDSANYPRTYYNKRNPFDISKISPL